MAAQQQQQPKPVPLPAKLAVGAVAGVLGTSFIYPIDIVKTRLQHQVGFASLPSFWVPNLLVQGCAGWPVSCLAAPA